MTLPDRRRDLDLDRRANIQGRNPPPPALEARGTMPRLLARWVRVRMAAAMTTSDLKVEGCTVLQYFDGRDPGDTVDVYNTKSDEGDEEGSGGSGGTYELSLSEGQVLWCRYNNKTGHYFALLGGGVSGCDLGMSKWDVAPMVAGRDYVPYINGDTGCGCLSPTTSDCCGVSGLGYSG